LLLCAVIFSPWAFGTTQDWAIWVMNTVGYVLGVLLLAKWLIRRLTGYGPARWGQLADTLGASLGGEDGHYRRRRRFSKAVAILMAGLTVLLLAYCLVSAANARATYLWDQQRLEYHECIPWLPHSYDRPASWFHFWMYLGLALTFWAARDWLLTISPEEEQELRSDSTHPARQYETERDKDTGSHQDARTPVSRSHAELERYFVPGRLRRLLQVICLNGALLATEGIIQRMEGSGKLLFLVTPRINKDAASQFGPYAYRGNAAEYLNLVWPVSFGFAWLLAKKVAQARRTGMRRVGLPHSLLVGGGVLMAACPIIAGTRGGAIISAALAPLVVGVLLVASRRRRWRQQLGLFLLFCVTLELALYVGWDYLKPRLESVFVDQLSGRPKLWENARRMAQEHPLFGTGPGTFASLYHLYRSDPTESWEACAHNDWLEVRITFGCVGFGLALLLLLMTPLNWLGGAGLPVHSTLVATICLALGGCLLHARFDFPFCIHSLVFLFLLLCCILCCAGRGR
jgi:O-antigen ligase